MSGSQTSVSPRPGAGAESETVARARQALVQAQARVDADRQAHSPGCVAVDQKGVATATQELAGALSSGTSLSLTV